MVLASYPFLQTPNEGISIGYISGQQITDIDIDYARSRRPLFTLGDVIGVLGAPAYAAFNPANRCVDLYFVSDQLMVSNMGTGTCDVSHFDAGNWAYSIDLSAPAQSTPIQMLKTWCGFRNSRQYAVP